MELKDKKTKVKFYNGMRTIGGTYIEISYEDSRIIFDFGAEYHPELERQPNNLQDILDCKLVPYIGNIFDHRIELIGYPKVKDGFTRTAVFLSHVHLDHSSMINFLDDSINLYTSNETKKLLEGLNIHRDFLFDNPNVGRDVRSINGVNFGDTIKVGDIEVALVAVDHDAYGACGMIINTPDYRIAYTGDIRLHGYRKADSLEFCKLAQGCDMLISEGVSVSFSDFEDPIGPDQFESEKALLDAIEVIMEENPNRQMCFNYYISNIERILSIINKSKRQVVLEAYYAYVLKHVTGKDVLFYRMDSEDYGLNRDMEVDIDTLVKDEGKYFWQLTEGAMKYIGELPDNCIYLHLDAQPLGDFDPAYKIFVKEFTDNCIEFRRMSCSGHAYPRDLLKIIDTVKPKLLVPIHSQKPEKLYNISGETILPSKNEII